ncbi:ABC transporter permease [Labrys monachus]|uniref:Ribose transport system permease protein n=1 Tax=Labrys monachus TaxID=217067 RepID=A0ABU0FFG8_9HYPH|nr:ABC transporter permease [Labrys monachus]MDQ0393352.1 ribose transport system permease protein [Labrys monachus]
MTNASETAGAKHSASAPRGRAAVAGVNWARFAEAYALLAATIALGALFGLLVPGIFLSWNNISTMLGSQAVLVVLGLALIIPLTAGDFDLSIASNLTLSAMIVAVLNAQLGWPLLAAMAAALAAGVVVGIVNAAFILYFRIPSLIVTLGTSTFIGGIVLWISDSNTISGIDNDLVDWVVVRHLFGIPLAFYYALLLCIAIWYFLGHTTAGRRLLFVGRGREVARLSGIRVERVRFLCLIASGVISSATGILYAGTIGAADPMSGQTFLLPAFAAAFLGATSITPGRFNAWGTLIAVYFLVIGITGLTMLGIQTFVQNLFYGGALVLAVALSQLVRKREPQEFS